jgi:hypothetical protein
MKVRDLWSDYYRESIRQEGRVAHTYYWQGLVMKESAEEVVGLDACGKN